VLLCVTVILYIPKKIISEHFRRVSSYFVSSYFDKLVFLLLFLLSKVSIFFFAFCHLGAFPNQSLINITKGVITCDVLHSFYVRI
jgi:hypothetical protein